MFYSAKLIFESRMLKHSDADPLKEERIVLIDALDEADAEKRALALGAGGEFEYIAVDGGIVSVKFLGLKNLHAIYADTFEHGTELYSEFL